MSADAERNAQARLAAIVDSSDDAIVSKDLTGIITSWNPGAERMFGWAAHEVIGRHITIIIPDERLAEEDAVMARIRSGEPVDHFETVRITRDGRRLDISLSVSPVRDPAGRIVGASKIARDFTERRRLEAERDALLIRERQAREAAEVASRAKDELLATVSHELRTPVTSLVGWVRMLQSGALDEATQSRALEVIVRSGTTLTQIVDDLLDLSRVATGRMRMVFEPCDLARLIEDAIDTVRPPASAKTIAIATDVAGELPILGAPDRLRQVVWNVLMNAVKFTPPGGRVEVTARRNSQAVEVVVSDTGIGISPEVLPHIFEPFRQEDSSSTRAHSGLGLGLALVQSIVELHGGDVVASSPGKGQGACFVVTLPLALPRRGLSE